MRLFERVPRWFVVVAAAVLAALGVSRVRRQRTAAPAPAPNRLPIAKPSIVEVGEVEAPGEPPIEEATPVDAPLAVTPEAQPAVEAAAPPRKEVPAKRATAKKAAAKKAAAKATPVRKAAATKAAATKAATKKAAAKKAPAKKKADPA